MFLLTSVSTWKVIVRTDETVTFVWQNKKKAISYILEPLDLLFIRCASIFVSTYYKGKYILQRQFKEKSHTNPNSEIQRNNINLHTHNILKENKCACLNILLRFFRHLLLILSLILNLFLSPFSRPLDLFLAPSSSLSFGGGGIMWLSGELNTRAEAAAARWIIDGNLSVTRLGLLTSLLLHLTAGLTRQNGGREEEGARKRGGGGVHCLDGGQSPPVTATELWMTGKWWANWCGINEPLFTWFIQSNVHVMIQQWSLFSPFTYHKFNMYSYCISFALWSCFLWSFSH